MYRKAVINQSIHPSNHPLMVEHIVFHAVHLILYVINISMYVINRSLQELLKRHIHKHLLIY